MQFVNDMYLFVGQQSLPLDGESYDSVAWQSHSDAEAYNSHTRVEEWMPWAWVIAPLVVALSLWGVRRNQRRRRLLLDTPTGKTTGVAVGLNELTGEVVLEEPLHSYLAECRCAHYEWSIEEHWRRTVTERYTDSKGKSRTRTKVESGWTTVASGGDTLPFWLRDEEGQIWVNPHRADLEVPTVFSRECRSDDALYYDKGPSGSIANSTHKRRFNETALQPEDSIYLLGPVRADMERAQPEVAWDKEASEVYIISATRTESQIARGYLWWGWLLGLLGVVALAVCGATLAACGGETWRVGGGILGGVLYIVLLVLVLALGMVNDMLRLRQRCERALAMVEVELQRRHDLLPRLVSTVQGVMGHEKDVQSSVANIRATGVSTSDAHGLEECEQGQRALESQLMVWVENYPELKASQAVTELQEQLETTEDRLALAREMANTTITFYNTRLLRFPDSLLANLVRMKRQPLLHFSGPRQAPAVEI